MDKQQNNWGILAILYFFLSGAAAGFYLLGSSLYLVDFISIGDMAKIGPISFILAALGGSMLLLELGQKFRFLLVFSNPKSIMTIGAVGLSGFSFFAFLSFFIIHDGLIIAGMFFALLMLLFQALEMANAKARPFWNTAGLIPIFLCNAAVSGMAILYFLGIRATWINGLAIGLIVLQAIILFGHIKIGAEARAFTRLLVQRPAFKKLAYGGILGVGTAAAILLLCIPSMQGIGYVLAIVGAYLYKLLLVQNGVSLLLPGEESNENKLENFTSLPELDQLERVQFPQG